MSRKASLPCGLSIVIPTYNERENIGKLLDKIIETLESKGCRNFEVIIVDDNSPDETYKIVETYSRRDPRVRLIVRKTEKGLGTAVKKGIEVAANNYVVVMDADFQHPPEVIPLLYEKALEGNYDVVVASRYVEGGGIEGWSKTRYLASRIGCFIARIAVHGARKVRDPMSGFFLVRKNAIDINKLKPKGYKILLEILGRHKELKTSEVPYTFKSRISGRSKVGISTLTDFVTHLFMLSDSLKFATVGGIGALVNLVVMKIVLGLGFGKEVSSIAGIEVSILSNFLANNFFTFKDRINNARHGFLTRLLLYHASSVFSAFTIFTTMMLTTHYIGLHPIEGQFIGILLGFASNYMASSRVIWHERGK